MKMNKYQSIFTKEDFKDLPREVEAEFYNFIDSVPFIKWLIQPEEIRGFAKDKQRWDNPNNLKNRKETKDGRIYVDLTKPHILEDINFFRERALFFNTYKKYTNLTPNPNPKSEYAKFWKEELRRWRYGLVRPSDGEWIPGGLYFYWNYCPIWIVDEDEEANGEGERRREFPHPWLGDYLFYHYMEQARNNGKHVKMLKTRGIGASFKMGSLSPRNMYIHPGSGNPNFHLASDKTFLQGDKGVFGKVIDTLDWIATNTPLPKLRLGDSKRAMEIQLGYLDEYGVRQGLLSSVFGISMKDNSDKARGIRGPLIHYEEDGVFPNLEATWNINRRAVEEGKVAYGQMVSLGCVCEGTKVWTKEGKLINIENIKQIDGILGYNFRENNVSQEDITYIQDEYYKECIRITLQDRILECSLDHPIAVNNGIFKEAKNLQIGDYVLIVNQAPIDCNIEDDWWYEVIQVVNIENIGVKRIYNLTANTTHTYLANGIITHNTGGVTGADFAGSEKLFYNPSAYNIYGIPNVFDKNSDGSSNCGFFWGAYLSRNSCYDLTIGEPNVTKALFEILIERAKIRASASDSKTITQNIAEEPITPQEAVMRIEGTVFPVADLKEYLGEVSSDLTRFIFRHYSGELVINSAGNVELRNTNEIYPIREFPALDNKRGAVEIFELPKRVKDNYRYIVGCLPAGEKVLTAEGLKDIETITLEDKLINQNGNKVDIINLQQYDIVDDNLYTVQLCNTLRTTTFTGEHPILSSNPIYKYTSYGKTKRLGTLGKYLDFDFEFKKASVLSKGDWMKIPNMYKTSIYENVEELWDNTDIRIDRQIVNPLKSKDFWWFIGLWLGDGWCEGEFVVKISFNKHEKYYIDKFEKITSTIFNRKFNKRVRNNCVEYGISNQQLNIFLTKNFGKYASGKFISENIKKIPLDLKKQLILGYLDSDGSILKNGKYYSTEFVSINYNLLESIQDILFSLNIVSGLTVLRKAGKHFILKKESNCQETYHLRVSHNDSIKLAKILGDYDDIKIKRIDFNNLPKTRRTPQLNCFFDATGNFIYIKIKDIKISKFTGKVYNFECETHTYMCKNIVTHNCDPYDDDIVEFSSSLGSAIVFDRWTRRIVAEYTGRPGTANEFYEIVYRLARFYNATIMYENNKKGLFTYFNNKGALLMLADTPEILQDKLLTKPKSLSGNVSKGVNATQGVNSYGLRLQADWMVEPAYDEDRNIDLEQEDVEKEPEKFIPNLRKIRSIGYLKEAIAWHPKLNADRVSAMGMVMIYDAELSQYNTGMRSEKIKTRADDPFFSKVYPIAKSGTLIGEKGMLKFGYKQSNNNFLKQ